jgi:hypothetical protein
MEFKNFEIYAYLEERNEDETWHELTVFIQARTAQEAMQNFKTILDPNLRIKWMEVKNETVAV